MTLLCPSRRNSITQSWYEALFDIDIRHHDPAVEVRTEMWDDGDEAILFVSALNTIETSRPPTARVDSLAISSVRLTYFPGTTLARTWLACAWAGYIQHEALELVTYQGDPGNRILDPHARSEWDRGLRTGFPVNLTPETLNATLLLVLPQDQIDALSSPELTCKS